ncbi:MAG: hypothetical protein D6701_15315, partial [Gemmatimonadetes bacterium]
MLPSCSPVPSRSGGRPTAREHRLRGAARLPAAALVFAVAAAAPVRAQETGGGAPPDSAAARPAGEAPAEREAPAGEAAWNPFAGFTTHALSNGVRVWFRELPGAADVSVSVGVPYGADQDPPGKEGTAHLLEHVLFSDHAGRSEQQIKDEIEGRGGRRNGITTWDHTWYYVTIGREHGTFAIEWLGRIVEPHRMDPELVDRNRRPVAVETNARPPGVAERLRLWLSPSWLRAPGFWRREFGLASPDDRTYDRWTSLQNIQPEDLQRFYESYYAPGAMVVTIVGDLPEQEALETAERAFGSLPARPVERLERALSPRSEATRRFYWSAGASARYQRRFRIVRPSPDDELRLVFLERYLSRRLSQRLRYGERKAIYSLRVSYTRRGPAAHLSIDARVLPDALAFADSVVDQELGALAAGEVDPEEWERDRTAVVDAWRTETRTPENLVFWTYRPFWDPDTHLDFPDPIGFAEDLSLSSLSAFAAPLFAEQNEISWLTRPLPFDEALLALAVAVWLWLVWRGAGWLLRTPVAMRDIRYVARLRYGLLYGLGVGLVFTAGAVVLGRLAYAGLERATLAWVLPLDDFALQAGAYGAMLAASAALLLAYLSLVPRKLLVFPDRILLKSLAYRSRVLEPGDIEFAAPARLLGAWRSRGLFGVRPLSLPLVRRGVLLQPTHGRALLLRTRDSAELLSVLAAWKPGLVVERLPRRERPAAPSEARPRAEPSTPEARESGAAPAAGKTSAATGTGASPAKGAAPRAGPPAFPEKARGAAVASKPGEGGGGSPGGVDDPGAALDDLDLDADLTPEQMRALGIPEP